MSKEHNTITDPEIHEPTGVSTAATGEVYIADGAASGDWTVSGGYEYRIIEIDDNTTDDVVLLATADFSVGTNYMKVDTVAGWSDIEGSSLPFTSNRINIADAALYQVEIICSVELIAGTGNVTVAAKISEDDATTGLAPNKTLHTLDFVGDVRTFSGATLTRLNAASSVTFFVAADKNSTVRFRDCRMAVSRARA